MAGTTRTFSVLPCHETQIRWRLEALRPDGAVAGSTAVYPEERSRSLTRLECRQPILVDPCRSRRVICPEQRQPVGSPLVNPFPELFLHHVLLARGCHRNEVEAVTPTRRFGGPRFTDELIVGPSIDVETSGGVDPSHRLASSRPHRRHLESSRVEQRRRRPSTIGPLTAQMRGAICPWLGARQCASRGPRRCRPAYPYPTSPWTSSWTSRPRQGLASGAMGDGVWDRSSGHLTNTEDPGGPRRWRK
jgi:hypothetical protein